MKRTFTRKNVPRIAWSAGVVLAAGAVFLLWQRGARDDGAIATSHDEARRDASASSLAARATMKTAASSDAMAAKRTDALGLEWNDGAHDVVGPVIEGTIVVSDMRDPKREEEEDGSFVPDFIDGKDSDPQEGDDAKDPARASRRVAVKHGRFRFDARGATVMLVRELELRRRPAVVERGIELAAGRPVALEAWWIDDVELHVVDATTKQELDDVTILPRDASYREIDESPGHPGVIHPADVVRDGVRSPFHLTQGSAIDPAMLTTGAIWVGARGHAWKRVKLDFEHETARTIALEAGGTLVVTVTEPADADAAGAGSVTRGSDRWPRLRLRQAPGDSVASLFTDFAADAEKYRFDGLEPGELTASIEIGKPFPSPLIVSRAAVTIVAGATAHATLSLDPSKAPKPTTLAGTIYVPPAWGDAVVQITVAPVDLRGGTDQDLSRSTRAPLEPIPGRPGWHVWSVNPILPGTYELFVERAGFETRVAVGPEGRDDVTLTLAEPAVVRVHVIDDETASETTVEALAWTPDREEDRVASFEAGAPRFNEFPTTLQWDAEAKCCIGVVQPGRGQIVSMNSHFATSGVIATGEEFTVHAGVNDLIVHVRTPCGIEFEIARASDVAYAVAVDWTQIGSSNPEFAGTHVVRAFSIPSRLFLPGPGRYRISRHATAKGGPDFSFEVDVPKGEFVKRTIDLQKE